MSRKTKFELEGWLREVTGESEIDRAVGKVEQALELLRIYPNVGVVSLMVGPGGLLNLSTTPNLNTEDGLDYIESALLDTQRNILNTRRQSKNQPEPQLDPEIVKEQTDLEE
jgi:hypothetical protein